jgi:hypothetical protein
MSTLLVERHRGEWYVVIQFALCLVAVGPRP